MLWMIMYGKLYIYAHIFPLKIFDEMSSDDEQSGNGQFLFCHLDACHVKDPRKHDGR